MPRNEFMNHEEPDPLNLMDMSIVEVTEKIRKGEITVNQFREACGLPPAPEDHPWEEGEDEERSLEVASVEADPHAWPSSVRPSMLAALRKVPGATTTEAHIAELYGTEDIPLS